MPSSKEEADADIDLNELTKPERLRTAALAAVDALPVVGGALARIMEEELPSRRWARIKDYLGKLRARLDALEKRINKETVSRDEVIELIETSIDMSARTHSEVKHEALAGLSAAALTTSPEYEEMRFFMSKVDILSPIHLRLLALIADPEGVAQRAGVDPNSLKGESLTGVLKRLFPGIDLDVLRSTWQDLYAQGFLNTESGIFGTRISSSGLDTVRGRVRPLGVRFVTLCQTGASPTA